VEDRGVVESLYLSIYLSIYMSDRAEISSSHHISYFIILNQYGMAVPQRLQFELSDKPKIPENPPTFETWDSDTRKRRRDKDSGR
jgi:hypothetical protein